MTTNPKSSYSPTASSSSAAPPPWIELPEDLTANILQRLDAEQILESAQKVCTTWWSVSKNPSMWRVIDLDGRRYAGDDFELICRRAVDRSQGELIHLKLEFHEWRNDLLNYIAVRSSKLLRLTLVDYDIPATDLVNAIQKLPHLEELHLLMMPLLDPRDFEAIGIFCPMLKSFTYNQHWEERLEFEDHDEGFDNANVVAIGKSMPNLHHLRLLALQMKNEGLEAILNGCPHLKSLDLRLCSGLDLRGALGKRCSESIKDLRLPYACANDISWLVKPPEYDYNWDDDDFVEDNDYLLDSDHESDDEY